MTEEAKKTEEEKKNSTVDGGAAGNDTVSGGDEENLSPEQKIINDLKGKATAAEERAAKAERERDDERQKKAVAQKEALTASERQTLAQEELINGNVSSAKTRFEAAQREYEEAYDSGDRKALIAAQIKLNDAQNAFRGAEYNQGRFKEWKESVKTASPTVSTSGSRFTKAEQDWIDAHPKFNSDRKYRSAVYAADEEAREKGIEIDSHAYFNHIEKYLKDEGFDDVEKKDPPKKEENLDDDPPKKTEKTDKKSSTAAPPSGSSSSPNGSGGRKNVFHMTPEHREAAAICFPELHKKDPKAAEEKYAARQLEAQELKRQGKL